MPNRVQLIRHVTAGANQFLGRQGEVTVDITKKELRVHDGQNAGGFAAARSDLANVASADLAAKLQNSQFLNPQLINPKTDVILENSSGVGVTIDGLLIKDGVPVIGTPVSAGTWENIVAAATAGSIAQSKVNGLEASFSSIAGHIMNTANPHAVTKTQVGLANVTNVEQLEKASNLSDVPNKSTARTNLGLAIGTHIPGLDQNNTFTGNPNTFSNKLVASAGVWISGTKAFNTGSEVALTDAASVAWDVGLAPVAKLTIGGARTLLNPTNQTAGQMYALHIVNGVASPTLAYGTAYVWIGGAPVITTGSGIQNILIFYSDGTKMYGVPFGLGFAA